MTGPPPLRPFELDPARIDPARIELIADDAGAHPLPAPLEPPAKGGRRPWLRLLVGAGALSLTGLLGLEAYQLLTALFDTSSLLGSAFATVFGLTLLGALGLIGQELLALRRLSRAEALRDQARRLMGSAIHGQSEPLLQSIESLYAGRPGLKEATGRYHRQVSDAHDDGERLRLFAQTVLRPLDREAYQLVKRGARDIGALTALSPLGLLDGLIVISRTLMMLRAIARLYGVRPGFAASIRLVKDAGRNLIAAGVGELVSDAAVETAGATVLSMLSARAGQGVVNGLLAARLGLSAMQICRPLPFTADEVPSLRQLRTEIFERKT
jgi:putative membrane protein